jgi:hypothetical protein
MTTSEKIQNIKNKLNRLNELYKLKSNPDDLIFIQKFETILVMLEEQKRLESL